ncbi:MAG: SAM-dependent chlorinase/fluorinase [SAR202 cluster bacterium]|nr:SAM-dependent chlorinase/fluorinase [SAR202 cluster bacterium]
MKRLITLTTDFGTRDGYVAAVKGVILGIFPDADIVDISHDIPPQDVAHASFVLDSAARYFPKHSIHVAVVDPGVGTDRKPLLLATPAGSFIGPDNGIFTHVLNRLRIENGGAGALPGGCAAYVLDREEYRLHPVSSTFHGRDVFGPAAAHLANGVAPERLGSRADSITRLALAEPFRRGRHIEGHIVYVDTFGNLVSDIPQAMLRGGVVSVGIADRTNSGLSETYGTGSGLVALAGSHGYLEIAWRDGNAAERLGLGVGATIIVELKREE